MNVLLHPSQRCTSYSHIQFQLAPNQYNSTSRCTRVYKVLLFTTGISGAILKQKNAATKRIKPVACSYLSDKSPKTLFSSGKSGSSPPNSQHLEQYIAFPLTFSLNFHCIPIPTKISICNPDYWFICFIKYDDNYSILG